MVICTVVGDNRQLWTAAIAVQTITLKIFLQLAQETRSIFVKILLSSDVFILSTCINAVIPCATLPTDKAKHCYRGVISMNTTA